MFLTERIVSLLTYALALMATYYLIGSVARKQYKAVLLFYLLILATFAFNYKPYITADLYRLREYIEYWIHKDWVGVVKYALKSTTPSWILYSYLISKLGNINWLQTITCLWCFGNIFYIIVREIERHDIKGEYRSELLFYIMAVGAFYLQTISGIRSMLGVSIVAFCFYRETVEKKSMMAQSPLWLFAALIHTSTMVLVIFRFLFLLVQSQGVVKKLLMSAVVFALAIFSYKYLGGYISGSIEYGQSYLNNTKEYTYIWEIIIGLIETVETLYVLNKYRRKTAESGSETEEHGLKNLYLFTLIWTAVSVISLPFSYAAFRRYTMLCTVTSIPLVAFLLSPFEGNAYDQKKNFRVLFWLSFLMFVLSGVRGDLCGYKFFVLS